MSTKWVLNQMVQAKWKGGDYFRGRITKINGDGTFAILFEDGEREEREPESDLSYIPHVTDKNALKVGTKVLALYKGGSTCFGTDYFSGTIKNFNSNGTFSVTYDDGDFEPEVDQFQVKFSDQSNEGNEEKSFEVNQKIEAEWSDGYYYPATITKVNNDGTYFVSYDDGSETPSQPRDKIKKASPKPKRCTGWPCYENAVLCDYCRSDTCSSCDRYSTDVPARLCNNCGFGSAKENCVKCNKWCGSSQKPAYLCGDCSFGSAKENCSKVKL